MWFIRYDTYSTYQWSCVAEQVSGRLQHRPAHGEKYCNICIQHCAVHVYGVRPASTGQRYCISSTCTASAVHVNRTAAPSSTGRRHCISSTCTWYCISCRIQNSCCIAVQRIGPTSAAQVSDKVGWCSTRSTTGNLHNNGSTANTAASDVQHKSVRQWRY